MQVSVGPELCSISAHLRLCIPPQKTGGWSWRVFWLFLGAFLLASAFAKLHGLSWLDPTESLFATPAVQVLAIQCELLAGIALLIGIWPVAVYRATAALFTAFAGVSAYQAFTGQASCACFGRIMVSPWVTLAIDVTVLIAMAYFRRHVPAAGSAAFSSKLFMPILSGSALVLLAPIGIALVIYQDPLHLLAWLRGESLVLEPRVLHLGTKAPGHTLETTITIRNYSEQPVHILGVSASCGCEADESLPITVPPKGSVAIAIRVYWPRMPGQFRRHYVLYTSASGQPRLVGWYVGKVAANDVSPPDRPEK
ncbi:MAG: hypothetical protein C4297_13840 [Gemmataceae bacterium]